MNFSRKIGWAAFLVALSSFNPSSANAATQVTSTSPATVQETNSNSSVSDRLNRIASTLKAKASQLPETEKNSPDNEVALGWANGGGGRGFANVRRGGWGNGYGGGFANLNPWRNGWGDGGGFFNRGWPNGGGWGNGGFFNRY